MRRTLAGLLGLLLALGVAAADEKKDGEIVWKAKATLPGLADEVRAAVEAGDTKALIAIGGSHDFGPWFVVDALCAAGDFDVALAFAKALDGKDVEALPAYIESERAHGATPKRFALLQTVGEHLDKHRHQDALDATEDVDPSVKRVVELYLCMRRSTALRVKGRGEECETLLKAVEETAEAMGWLGGVSNAIYWQTIATDARNDVEATKAGLDRYDEVAKRRGTEVAKAWALGRRAAFFTTRHRDLPKAIELNRQVLKIWETLDHPTWIAATHINLGNAISAARRWDDAIPHFEKGLAIAKRTGHRLWAINALIGLGLSRYRSGKLDESLPFYERALALSEEGKAHSQTATVLSNIGLVYMQKRQPEKALPYMERSARANREAGRFLASARTWQSLGVARSRRNMSAAAGEAYREAVEDAKLAQERSVLDSARLQYATMLAVQHQYEKANTVLAEALTAAEQNKDEVILARVRSTQGELLLQQFRYEEAADVLEQARTVLRPLEDRSGYTIAVARLARAERGRGNLERAEKLFQSGIQNAQRIRDFGTMAACMINRGAVLVDRMQYDEALQALQQAHQVAQALGNPMHERIARESISAVYVLKGDRRQALKHMRLAIQEARRTKDKAYEARALRHLAKLQRRTSQLSRAVASIQRAHKLYEELGQAAQAANAISELGGIYHLMGQYGKALTLLEQARDAQVALGLDNSAALSETRIADAYSRLGMKEESEASYRRAIQAFEAMGNKHALSQATINLGNVQLARGDVDEALASYTRGRDMAQSIGLVMYVTVANQNLGAIHLQRKEYPQARAFFEQARQSAKAQQTEMPVIWAELDLGYVAMFEKKYDEALTWFEKAADRARSARTAHLLVRALSGQARVHLSAGRTREALRLAQQASRESEEILGGLAESEGATLRSRLARNYEIGAVAAFKEEDADAALMFLERGRAGALLDALDQRDRLRWNRESLPQHVLDLEKRAKAVQEAARQSHEAAAAKGDMKRARETRKILDEASERVAAVATRIQRLLRQAEQETFVPQRRTLEDVQGSLGPGEALVLFSVTRYVTSALVVRDLDAKTIKLGLTKDIRALVEAFDPTDTDADPAEHLSALRKTLIEPLRLGEDVKLVLISPEDVLSYLPFGALLERTVSLTPSGTTHVLLREEPTDTGDGIVSLGDPAYGTNTTPESSRVHRGGALVPLPATRKEAMQIGTTVLLGKEATETGLRKAIPQDKRLRAIHLACHGLINVDRPSLSSLALSKDEESDGFLTAAEIWQMQIPADLAVLSACETGKGRIVGGEGIVGLTRAFMYAGAPRVVCSLWKVDDEATQALMLKFYELWNPKTGKGLPAAQALQQAQAHVRSQDKWKHPYYWAAWVLWGLPE